MEFKYLIVKELVKKCDIIVEHIVIENMIADPFTKGLCPNAFKKHV